MTLHLPTRHHVAGKLRIVGHDQHAVLRRHLSHRLRIILLHHCSAHYFNFSASSTSDVSRFEVAARLHAASISFASLAIPTRAWIFSDSTCTCHKAKRSCSELPLYLRWSIATSNTARAATAR